MLCPECNSQIKATNYDPEFEWYECPKCDGAFTPDEILKAEMERQKAAGGVRAKGKLRRTQIELDEVAEQNVAVATISTKASVREGKTQVPSKQVINVMADAIEEAYREFHSTIDRTNANDKATILLRSMLYGGSGTRISEKEIPIPLCKEHRQ